VDPISGILGAALGESSSQTAARIEEAKKSANNISGLVRKKAKDETNGHDANGAASGKRKADDAAMEGVEKEEGAGSKKARVENAMES
jgi:HAT1-interacting factor 1